MLRHLSRGLLGAAALALAVTPGVADTKAGRVVVNDPEKAKADSDFQTQGEYQGENDSKQKVGAQVVALGSGAFDVRLLTGGLPGDGWDGKTQVKATARRGDDGAVTITGGSLSGGISAGTLTVKRDGAGGATLTRVERKSKTLGAKPPEGAVVLFGGPGDETKWNGGKLADLSDGKFLNAGVTSKPAFGGFKAHAEFRTPWMPAARGQGRGNSGFYIQDRYECQVLDSFGLAGENNECGGFYTLHKPAVNMCLPPLAWQTYDVEFTPAAFDADGKKTKSARATVYHNGVKVHDDVELANPTPGSGLKETAAPGPFQLQNHGDPVVFNNVWVVETK